MDILKKEKHRMKSRKTIYYLVLLNVIFSLPYGSIISGRPFWGTFLNFFPGSWTANPRFINVWDPPPQDVWRSISPPFLVGHGAEKHRTRLLRIGSRSTVRCLRQEGHGETIGKTGLVIHILLLDRAPSDISESP